MRLSDQFLLRNIGRQPFGGFDAQLLIHIHAAKHDLDVSRCNVKFIRQESHHVVGCPARARRGGDADFELMAIGFADGIL